MTVTKEQAREHLRMYRRVLSVAAYDDLRQFIEQSQGSGQAPAPTDAKKPIRHDYPACAIFRGGKCTCDEADNLCPQCGSEEWDEVYEHGYPPPVGRRCARCDNEWKVTQ